MPRASSPSRTTSSSSSPAGSGEHRTIRWSSTVQRNAVGEVAGIVTIGEDITERRRADEALREREEHFRSLIEHASDVICVLAPDGTSLYESPSVERVTETSSGSSEPAAPSA